MRLRFSALSQQSADFGACRPPLRALAELVFLLGSLILSKSQLLALQRSFYFYGSSYRQYIAGGCKASL